VSEIVDIASIHIGERARKDMGDIDALAASIKVHGLIHPPAVQPDGTLIAGQRRILACQQLGWTQIPVRVIAVEDLLSADAQTYAEMRDEEATDEHALMLECAADRRDEWENEKREAA
jgi:ParB-like chromosome segregation protein Spo0J